jgi:hypothetical protein
MGLAATAKVITRSEYHGKRASLQPGNREWVTLIELVNACGRALPPYIIFKGKVFIQSWFDELPKDSILDTSPNGWTTDTIGLSWLQMQFIPQVEPRSVGKWKLLILGGHSSHLTAQFDQICEDQSVCQHIHHICSNLLMWLVLRL